MRTDQKIAILGAGFGGLSAAYDLVKVGKKVTIYEAAGYAGGLASGFKEPHWDWSVEKYYHHWFASDRHMLNLINELGWQDRVLFPRPYTVLYHKGKFFPFDSILQAILFPGLGWGIRKVRFGLVGLFMRLTNNWQALEKVTVEAFLRKWAGDQVYELMWQPLLVGKFGERYATQVNMAWMWARFKARTTHLGTFVGGFQAFADELAAHLEKSGVEFRYNTPVEKLSLLPDQRLSVQSPTGQETYDQVLVTTSPALLNQIAPSLNPDYLEGLLELKSMGAVVMVLSLKHQLSEKGYYWFNLPKAAGFPFLALVEHTNFVAPEHFGGDHIVYCGDYLGPDHEYFQLSEAELLSRFLPGLARINPNFRPDWVKKTWLFRTSYAQPVPLLNHSRNIPSIRTPWQSLYFASMSQVYPWDRGTNYAVEISRKAAEMMLEDGSNP
jgi:protoporphyrinogen oxidase